MLTPRFADALVFATHLHADQTRKGDGTTPYIAHLLAVTALVLEYGGDEDMAIAALLHDAVEDQGGPPTRERIRARYGDRVTAIVDGCTDTDEQPKPPWQARKEAYLAHLPQAAAEIRLVSAADKLHNVRSAIQLYHIVGEDLWRNFKGGQEGTLWYYRALITAFQAAGSNPLVEELDRAVTELEQLVAAEEGGRRDAE